MRAFNKIIFFIFISMSSAYSCALCALFTPTAHVYVDFSTQDNEIKNIKFRWEFSGEFTSALIEGFDTNRNSKLDSFEMKEIEAIFIDYTKSKNFLTQISYYDQPDGKLKKVKVDSKDIKMSSSNGLIFCDFSVNVTIPIQNDRVIKILVEDSDDFFHFNIQESKNLQLPSNFTLIPSINLNSAFYEIKDSKSVSTMTPTQALNASIKVTPATNKEAKKLSFISQSAKDFLDQLKSLLRSSQNEKPARSITLLLIISFIYGFLHAAGPGHGKTLTGAYFTASGGNWMRALMFSARIGIIHVAGAMILVATSMFIIQTFVSKIVNDVAQLTTKVGAIIVIVISIFMLIKKLRSYKKQKVIAWHESSCGCSSCNPKTLGKDVKVNDWLVSIVAGVVPCPGTIVVFSLAFSLGSYFIGFLSAIFMSLGMSAVIFLTALFGQYLHSNTLSRFKKYSFAVEVISILLIFFLGVITYNSTSGIF